MAHNLAIARATHFPVIRWVDTSPSAVRVLRWGPLPSGDTNLRLTLSDFGRGHVSASAVIRSFPFSAFATDSLLRAPARIARLPASTGTLARALGVRWALTLRTARVTLRLTAHRELRPTCFTPSAVSGGAREHLESWGLSIEIRALEVRLSPAALSSADEKSGATSDTQFAWRPSRSSFSAARIASTADPSRRAISCDSGCLPSASVRSDSPLARGFLGREPRTGLSGFAARIRLPTLLRSLLRREGARPSALVRSSRTLAFGHAPLVDFCNQNDPQARPTESGVLGSTWPSSLARRR